MGKITYDTKVDARVLGGNRVNKVVAADMNEVKESVNALYDAGADWAQYSTAGRNLITGQPVGYRIFNTTENRPEFWNGSEWLPIAAGVKDIHCGGSPNYPSALEGDVLQVTGNGKIGGTSGKNVFVKDLIVCLEANAGGTDASVGSKWRIVRDIPQLSTAQRDSLSNPNAGLMIYNTDMNMFNYFNGTIWIVLASIFFGTTDEIDAATLPAGSFYYDTYIEEAGWSDGVTSNPFPTGAMFWKTTGNAGTNPTDNFIGTTDGASLKIVGGQNTNNSDGISIDGFSDSRSGIQLTGISNETGTTVIGVSETGKGLFLSGTTNDNGADAVEIRGDVADATKADIIFTATNNKIRIVGLTEYADDAAADADTTLPSGCLYKLTGSRSIYQKP